MSATDVIAVAALAVAIVGIGFPIYWELRRWRKRLELSIHYWIEEFAQANHLCASWLRLHGSVDENLRRVLADRVSNCIKSLSENADYIEKHLEKQFASASEEGRERPSRLLQLLSPSARKGEHQRREKRKEDASQIFHLMTTELEWRTQQLMNWNSLLFSYCVSSVLTLILGVRFGRERAIEILVDLENDYQADRHRAEEAGSDPPSADEEGRTLTSVFFHEAIRPLLSNELQEEISAGSGDLQRIGHRISLADAKIRLLNESQRL